LFLCIVARLTVAPAPAALALMGTGSFDYVTRLACRQS
jgi:hypothetical protein